MKRWLARELVRRDGSLAGFWPLAFDMLDHAGLARHAQPARSTAPNTADNAYQSRLVRSGGRPGFALAGTDFLTCGTSGDFTFNYSTSFTVSVWFYRTSSNTTTPLVAKNGTVNTRVTGWDLSLSGGNALFRLMGDYAGNSGLSLQAVLVSDGTLKVYDWNHLLVTYDGGGMAAGVRFFLNGRQLTASISYDTNAMAPAYAGNLLIGAATQSSGTLAVSTAVNVALVRVYQRELRHNEVAALYRRELEAPAWKQRLVTPSHLATPPPGLTLFLAGSLPASGNAPLYVYGWDVASHRLPLFLQALSIPATNRQAPLYVGGSTQPGIVRQAPLFISGGLWTQTEQMNLFLLGSPVDQTVRSLNLWTQGSAIPASRQTTLYLHNDQQGTEGSMTLFLQVAGQLLGGQAAHESMNLFLQRPLESVLPLVLLGPGSPLTNSMPLFTVSASTLGSQTVTLAIPNVLGVLTPNLTLYTHGW